VAMKIYKYPVKVGEPLVVRGLGKVLLFAPQGAEGLFVWAEVLVGGVDVTLDVLPTGAAVPYRVKHWASCQEGPYVWHLYERLDR
jgi:hypothetical protein